MLLLVLPDRGAELYAFELVSAKLAEVCSAAVMPCGQMEHADPDFELNTTVLHGVHDEYGSHSWIRASHFIK